MSGGLPAWCADYIGIPFKERGRDRQGIDCYGLVALIFKEQCGIDLPLFVEGYERIKGEEANISAQIQAEAVAWETVTDPDPFDVAVFRIAGLPLHVGVVAIPGYMIHALKGCDVSCERYQHPLWQPRLDGFYRYAA